MCTSSSKADQRSSKLTEGVVAKLLTKSGFHPHGNKVMLEDGQAGSFIALKKEMKQ